VAQHIWASVSHLLQYKTESSAPPSVRRSIHRVSALLETVDLEFERVLNERAAYVEHIANQSKSEQLNVDLLAKTLTELWPPQNKAIDEQYQELLTDLKHFSIETNAQLKELILRHRDDVLQEEAALLSRIKTSTGSWMPRERAEKGVYFTHAGLTRRALERQFPGRFRTYMGTKARKRRKIKKRLAKTVR
jgi:putative GTP pyrophosphokinase